MKITAQLTDAAVLAELGSRLERVRLERNVTQEQLAAEAGVSRSTVVRAEAGEPVKTTALVRILRALALAELLDLLVPEPLPSPIELARRQGSPRRRATSPTRHRPPAAEGDGRTQGGWSWGDETPGAGAA